MPFPVANYINKITIEERSPAYLLVENGGNLVSWGGKLSAYGIENLQKGKLIGEQVFIFDGLLPLDSMPLFLSCVKAGSGISADIHIFREDEENWILLLDATLEEVRRSSLQQKANELSVLQYKLSENCDQYIDGGTRRGFPFPERSAGHRDVAILFANIQELTLYSSSQSPEDVLQTLTQYICTIAQSITDNGGMVKKILGDSVMAVFGLEILDNVPSIYAVEAALRMFDSIKSLNKRRKADGKTDFDIAVGIASGSVILGILEMKERKIFSAVGCAVNVAELLNHAARPNEILIDENTFKNIGELKRSFSLIDMKPEDTGKPLQTFSYRIN